MNKEVYCDVCGNWRGDPDKIIRYIKSEWDYNKTNKHDMTISDRQILENIITILEKVK